MSDMEVFYGAFTKSDLAIEPEDTDDFYDLEKEHGCYYVKVNGQLYSFYKLKPDLDAYGFSFVIEPSGETRFIALWYNGGAGIHEVVRELIAQYCPKGIWDETV